MKASDKENNKNKKQVPSKAGKEARRRQERSRSHSRENRRRAESITMREANGEEGRDYIEISDDEADAELLERYYKIGGEYHLIGEFESLNWRERRRLERLFAREERKYR